MLEKWGDLFFVDYSGVYRTGVEWISTRHPTTAFNSIQLTFIKDTLKVVHRKNKI